MHFFGIHSIKYGYVPVKLPDSDKQIWMLVVRGFGKKPMMLLTTEPLRRNIRVQRRILFSYLRCWSIEETIRFVKQSYDLENIRVLSYTRLKNMMALLVAVFYFISVILDTNKKLVILASHILKISKRVFGVPSFKYYALEDGLRTIFQRYPGKMVPTKRKSNFGQLSFDFM